MIRLKIFTKTFTVLFGVMAIWAAKLCAPSGESGSCKICASRSAGMPAVDPAAIREAALEDALVAARQAILDGAYIYRGSNQETPSGMLFVAERMVSKAINSLIGEKNEH